jgi:hypothetical protein
MLMLMLVAEPPFTHNRTLHHSRSRQLPGTFEPHDMERMPRRMDGGGTAGASGRGATAGATGGDDTKWRTVADGSAARHHASIGKPKLTLAYAAPSATVFRFLRHPSRPITPRPVAKSGSAAGKGAVPRSVLTEKLSTATVSLWPELP